MTIDDFLKRWNHPGGDECLEVDEFNITLVPHPSSYTSTQPVSELRFRIECVVSIGIYPRIYETVESHALQSRSADEVVSELLDRLNVALSERRQKINEGVCGDSEPEKPVLLVIAGAGFSAGFGLPVTAGLRHVVAQPCDRPESDLRELYEHRLADYPVMEYLREDGSISDLEYLLTIWEGYRRQLHELDGRQGRAHDLCYERFVRHVCCHLYRLSWRARDGDQFRDNFCRTADWLARAKQRFDVRFVTFNYDVVLELLCGKAGFAFNYAERSDVSAIPIRKLHGSANWQVVNGRASSPNMQMDLLYETGGRCTYAFPDVDSFPYGVSRDAPVVIPPMAAKSYRGLYEWLWTYAAQDVLAAERILIVGYSFPRLDVFAASELQGLLRKAERPVTYVLPDRAQQTRVAKLLKEVPVTCICENWRLEDLDSVL